MIFFLMKTGIHIVYLKNKYMSPYYLYSVSNMSACRKLKRTFFNKLLN